MIMKAKLLIIMALSMNLFFNACAGPFSKEKGKVLADEWIMPDSALCADLGSGIVETLFATRKVKCYELEGKKKVDVADTEVIKGFVRKGEATVLTVKQLAVLQYILLSDNKSYKQNEIRVESPFIPRLEFEFVGKNKRTASVVISLSDMSWVLIYDGKQQFNYDYYSVDLVNRFCKSLLK